MQRRRFLGVAGSGFIVAGAGCLAPATTDPSAEAVRVGMVTPSGGVNSGFGRMAVGGLEEAGQELRIAYETRQPATSAEIGEHIRAFATQSEQPYDLICCLGVDQKEPLVRVAGDHPGTNFVLVDAVAESDGDVLDNVASYVYREHEGSYLAGILAAHLSTRTYEHAGGRSTAANHVGFLGAKRIPVIERFEAGYRAGARQTVADVSVSSEYVGAWNDKAEAAKLSRSMYDAGADVIYHAAGASGTGLFETAASLDRFAIGVDTDQSKTHDKFADVIVASMRKRVDRAVFEAIKAFTEGQFMSGAIHDLGLAESAVDLVVGTAYEGALPEPMLTDIDSARAAISAGDRDVPDNLEDIS
jgi:basic membrane protein A